MNLSALAGFLDEIGDMPLGLQPSCSASCRSVGSRQLAVRARVDVRVVAATNQYLKRMAQDREFREACTTD
jgi:transcriptional regulator with GAF, ATPase, and Fis domain